MKTIFALLVASINTAPLGAADQSAKALGIEVSKTHVIVKARGRASDQTSSETQRRSLSRDAAIATAQAHLLMWIGALESGKKTLGDLGQKDKKIKIKVKGALSYAERLRTEWKDDGSAEVTLALAKKYLKKIRRGLKIP